MDNNNRQFYIVLFVLALAVNFSGINVGFFTDDPGLYASLSKNLIYKKEFLQLFTYNQDWLDKPHFPFWMIVCSFKLFGISVWAYRLPALLFFVLSVWYTWLFSKKYYGTDIAIIAVLILTTAMNTIMANTDIRAEPYLMGLLMGSIYHISQLEERYTFTDLLLAALLTACAIMTKGLFVIVAIGGGLLVQLLVQKKISSLFRFKWLFLILLTLLFILPECYALYIQFDMHPEKLVFGRRNVSGIKWFLWDSQFGRFVNTGPITHKSGDVFFFLHTLLWAFAPWCLVFYYAIYKSVKSIIQKTKLPEYYTIGGGLLLLLLFSISKFQLPFYTNTLFPLFAIITAPYFYGQLSRFGTQFRLIGQWLYIILLPLAVLLIHFFSAPGNTLFFVIDVVAFAILVTLIWRQVNEAHKKAFLISCCAVLFANFYLNTVFYKQLVTYKGQITAADYINQNRFNNYHIYSFRAENNIFQFYCKKPVDLVQLEQFTTFKADSNSAFYASQQSMDYLLQTHAGFRVIRSFVNYPQENILSAFINQATRSKVLDHVYLITK
jgi:4-amino-4-deoxy-L-arabinose transferase-like glycosyltransferase